MSDSLSPSHSRLAHFPLLCMALAMRKGILLLLIKVESEVAHLMAIRF